MIYDYEEYYELQRKIEEYYIEQQKEDDDNE